MGYICKSGHPSCDLAHRSNANKGVGGKRLPATKHGARPSARGQWLEPGFQVHHQDEPTASHPISQHKKFAGMEHPGQVASHPGGRRRR